MRVRARVREIEIERVSCPLLGGEREPKAHCSGIYLMDCIVTSVMGLSDLLPALLSALLSASMPASVPAFDHH